MDSLRSVGAEEEIEQALDDGGPHAPEGEPHLDAPPAIGVDERRMHVRAYNYWVSLLGNRAYPSIEDIDPAGIGDFGAHSVLLDFTEGPADPAIPFVGQALREEGGLAHDIALVSDVPKGSLISRLTDHYLQIIANRAPIGFEAEYVNRRGHVTMYRGILMPFSSDDDTIDFLYGVINWKECAEAALGEALAAEVAQALAAPAVAAPTVPVWADGPSACAADPSDDVLPQAAFAAPLFGDQPGDAAVEHRAGEPVRGVAADLVLPEAAYSPLSEDAGPAEDVGLCDRLAAARESVEVVRRADGRGRAALYRALGLAYDFALLARARPEEYAVLLADAALKAQARAPMTPLVKLVFGADYDKTRLTEFAAALRHGLRVEAPLGGLGAMIEGHAGGLKGLVAAERRARAAPARPDAGDAARARLRLATPQATLTLGAGDEEFVLLVARRERDGALSVLASLADSALVDRAIRKVRA